MEILKRAVIIFLMGLSMSLAFALPRMAYIGASLAVPGGGEMLLGRETRGGTLMAVDILAIYAFLATNREIDSQEAKYKNFAHEFAGVPLEMPDNHYQAVQDYISSDYYNDIITMMGRNYYLISNYNPEEYEQYVAANIYTGDEQWSWESDADWQAYKDMRKRIQKSKMNHSLSLGVMLLNRVASAIDTAILSGHNKREVYMYFTRIEDNGMMLNIGRNF